MIFCSQMITKSFLLADSLRRLSGDYFFHCENGILTDYGKDMPEAERTSEYVGIARIQKQEIACFRKQMEQLVHAGITSFVENTYIP